MYMGPEKARTKNNDKWTLFIIQQPKCDLDWKFVPQDLASLGKSEMGSENVESFRVACP